MMFAPFYLMDAFAGAQIENDSIQRPLAEAARLIVDATPGTDESGWIFTPLQCALLFIYIDSRRYHLRYPSKKPDYGE